MTHRHVGIDDERRQNIRWHVVTNSEDQEWDGFFIESLATEELAKKAIEKREALDKEFGNFDPNSYRIVAVGEGF